MGWTFLLAAAWVSGGLMALLALPGVDAPDTQLVLGLPPRAAFLLVGVGLAPGLVVPLAYALVFDRETLTEDDLAELRQLSQRIREAEALHAGGSEGVLDPGRDQEAGA